MDELADRLGIDRLEFRHRNALRAGDTTATGQMLAHSAGLAQCLEALRPHWQKAHDEVAAFNARRGTQAPRRRHRLHVVRHRQHLDVQPLAHARRPVAGRHADALQRRGRYRPGLQHHHDPDRRRRAGPAGGAGRIWSRATPTSPPMPARPRRRARPSSRARRPKRAGRDLRQQILRLANAGADAELSLDGAKLTVRDGGEVARHRPGERRRADGRGHLRSADHAARCRRPGRALCHLCLRRPDGRRSRSISSSAR